MPYQFTIVPELALELVRFTGVSQAGEMMSCLHEIDRDPRHDRDFVLLMDVREAARFVMTPELMQRVAQLIAVRAEQGMHRTNRVAYLLGLTPDPSVGNMARLFIDILGQHAPKIAGQHAAASTLTEALDWLGVDAEPDRTTITELVAEQWPGDERDAGPGGRQM